MLKSEKFWDFRVLTSKVVKFLMPIGNRKSIPLQILYPYSISWNKTPLYFFSSKNIYFAQKEPIKVETFETFECSSQNLSISLCQFWSDKSIPLQILYPYPILWKITPLYFFNSKNIYLVQKEHIKMKIFETFKCSGQNSSNSSYQRWNDKPIPLQILSFFIFMTDNSSVDFKLILFQLWIKGSHQKSQFWDFQVLWWKLTISLMSFSKPQVSWK